MNDDKKAALLRLFQEATRPASDDGRPGNGISINIHTGNGDGNGIGNTIINNADLSDLESITGRVTDDLKSIASRAAADLARLEQLATQATRDLEQLRYVVASFGAAQPTPSRTVGAAHPAPARAAHRHSVGIRRRRCSVPGKVRAPHVKSCANSTHSARTLSTNARGGLAALNPLPCKPSRPIVPHPPPCQNDHPPTGGNCLCRVSSAMNRLP